MATSQIFDREFTSSVGRLESLSNVPLRSNIFTLPLQWILQWSFQQYLPGTYASKCSSSLSWPNHYGASQQCSMPCLRRTFLTLSSANNYPFSFPVQQHEQNRLKEIHLYQLLPWHRRWNHARDRQWKWFRFFLLNWNDSRCLSWDKHQN